MFATLSRVAGLEFYDEMSCETLSVYPDEIQFHDVRPNQTYIQTAEVLCPLVFTCPNMRPCSSTVTYVLGVAWQIRNMLQSTCSFRIRPSSADRISVEPNTVSLAAGEVKRVQIKLKLQGKSVPKKKGGAPYRYDTTTHVAMLHLTKYMLIH